jgi:hypothetical protein
MRNIYISAGKSGGNRSIGRTRRRSEPVRLKICKSIPKPGYKEGFLYVSYYQGERWEKYLTLTVSRKAKSMLKRHKMTASIKPTKLNNIKNLKKYNRINRLRIIL